MDRIKLDVRGVKLDTGRGEQGKQKQRQLHARFFGQFGNRIRLLGENSTPVKCRNQFEGANLYLKILMPASVSEDAKTAHFAKSFENAAKCRPVGDSVVGPNQLEQASPVLKQRNI